MALRSTFKLANTFLNSKAQNCILVMFVGVFVLWTFGLWPSGALRWRHREEVSPLWVLEQHNECLIAQCNDVGESRVEQTAVFAKTEL